MKKIPCELLKSAIREFKYDIEGGVCYTHEQTHHMLLEELKKHPKFNENDIVELKKILHKMYNNQ